MQRPNRAKFVLTAIVLLLVLIKNTSNKDRTELENRTYVMGMSVDAVPNHPEQVNCSVEVVVWKELGVAGQPGSSSPQKPTWQPKASAYTLTGSLYKLGWLSYRKLSLAHLESIIIGEEYARTNMVQLVSFSERNSEVQGKLQLAVTKGRGSDVLMGSPRIDKVIYSTVSDLSNIKGMESELYGLYLEDVANQIIRKEPTYVPWISLSKGEVKLMGLGLFLKGSLAGFITRDQVKGLSFLAGKQRNGILEFKHTKGEKWLKAYRVSGTSTMYDVEEKDGKLYIYIDTWMEGNLLEDIPNVLRNGHITATQFAIEKKVRKSMEEALRLSEKFGADLAGIKYYMKQSHPWMYARYEKNWDAEIGKSIIISIRNVTARIRRIGMID